jgi:carbon monoxide dehydrogenase subunit G
MAPEIPVVQSVRNQNRLSSKTDLEILSSFLRKEMNTKVEDNFVAHNLDTEFASFGVRT